MARIETAKRRRASPDLRSIARILPWGAVAFGVATFVLIPSRAANAHPARLARINAGYADMVRRWHAPPVAPPVVTAAGRPALVLEILNTNERVELSPQRDDGGFTAEDVEGASHVLRDPRNDEECEIDPRVLDLAYVVQTHFRAKAVRVVSAFRMPHGKSNHGKGRALDIIVPGTRDGELARFARTIGFVGVGLYPRSGFVHLDSRPRSYFWVDASGPGQRSRSVPVFPKLAASSDAQALAEGRLAPTDGPSEDDDESVAEAPSADERRKR